MKSKMLLTLLHTNSFPISGRFCSSLDIRFLAEAFIGKPFIINLIIFAVFHKLVQRLIDLLLETFVLLIEHHHKSAGTADNTGRFQFVRSPVSQIETGYRLIQDQCVRFIVLYCLIS